MHKDIIYMNEANKTDKSPAYCVTFFQYSIFLRCRKANACQPLLNAAFSRLTAGSHLYYRSQINLAPGLTPSRAQNQLNQPPP
jgi:hypothetical protein